MLTRRWARALYISTYVALIVGIGLSLLVTGYDLIQQTLALAQGGGRYFYIFILVGAYVATGVFAGIVALARLYTVRKALFDIPKRYMPIKKIDVPNVVHKLISSELSRSAIIRHSTLPNPSHKGFSPTTMAQLPNTAYTPVILHSAILIMSKASRLTTEMIHRKHETLRQYIMRARAMGLWKSDVANEGLFVWLATYESVRFGGVELSEGEFLATMKLVYFLLMEMKPSEKTEKYEPSLSSSSSSSITGSDVSEISRRGSDELYRMDTNMVGRIESLLPSSPRRSGDAISLNSMIDHGSILEHALDREERERRMRGGRLGEREGSVIYYDVDD